MAVAEVVAAAKADAVMVPDGAAGNGPSPQAAAVAQSVVHGAESPRRDGKRHPAVERNA